MTITWQDIGVTPHAAGRTERRLPCPMCDKGPRDTALGVNIDTGTFHCFRCGFKGKVDGAEHGQSIATRIDDPRALLRKRERLNSVWRSAIPIDAPGAWPLRTYLECRRLASVIQTLHSGAVRFHPSLEYFNGHNRVGKFPAMVCMFSGAYGEPRTLHLSWLRQDGLGKAQVPAPRKLLPGALRGKTAGGAIRLHADAAVMGVAEGIETALSLHLLHAIPVWSAFCALNLEQVRLPPYVRRVLIGVDLDANGTGERAAEALAKRLRSWRRAPEVLLVRPTGAAPRDLNDELVNLMPSSPCRHDGINS